MRDETVLNTIAELMREAVSKGANPRYLICEPWLERGKWMVRATSDEVSAACGKAVGSDQVDRAVVELCRAGLISTWSVACTNGGSPEAVAAAEREMGLPPGGLRASNRGRWFVLEGEASAMFEAPLPDRSELTVLRWFDKGEHNGPGFRIKRPMGETAKMMGMQVRKKRRSPRSASSNTHSAVSGEIAECLTVEPYITGITCGNDMKSCKTKRGTPRNSAECPHGLSRGAQGARTRFDEKNGREEGEKGKKGENGGKGERGTPPCGARPSILMDDSAAAAEILALRERVAELEEANAALEEANAQLAWFAEGCEAARQANISMIEMGESRVGVARGRKPKKGFRRLTAKAAEGRPTPYDCASMVSQAFADKLYSVTPDREFRDKFELQKFVVYEQRRLASGSPEGFLDEMLRDAFGMGMAEVSEAVSRRLSGDGPAAPADDEPKRSAYDAVQEEKRKSARHFAGRPDGLDRAKRVANRIASAVGTVAARQYLRDQLDIAAMHVDPMLSRLEDGGFSPSEAEALVVAVVKNRVDDDGSGKCSRKYLSYLVSDEPADLEARVGACIDLRADMAAGGRWDDNGWLGKYVPAGDIPQEHLAKIPGGIMAERDEVVSVVMGSLGIESPYMDRPAPKRRYPSNGVCSWEDLFSADKGDPADEPPAGEPFCGVISWDDPSDDKRPAPEYPYPNGVVSWDDF